MPAALAVLPFRWRASAAELQAAWRADSAGWAAGQTVADVRRALAPQRGSTATLAAESAPLELWHHDVNGGLSLPDPPFRPAALLSWMNATYREARLGEQYDDGSPKAFLLFTFPPAPAEETAAAKSILGDGFPRLDPKAVSSSRPSVGRDDHSPATIHALSEHDLGVCTGLELARRTPSMVWLSADKSDGWFHWATDVHFIARLVFEDIWACTGLEGHLQVSYELSVFGTSSDMWVMTARGRPVGIVQVKKPSRRILENEEVAGQMYDYLNRLRAFYGLRHVFGIATTYAEWRLFWLRDDATEAAAVASPPATCSDEAPNGHAASWQRDLGVPRWRRSDSSPVPSEPGAPPTPLRDRAVRAGPVLGYGDHHAVIEMVASAFFKMLQSPTEPLALVSRQRSYIQLTEESWLWVTLNAEFQLMPGVLPASNTKNLLLLADLRGGIEGRLWLASTVHGAVCVLKFAKDGKTDVLEHECAMWHRLWGRADVRLLRLGGSAALVMPYVHMATEEDWARPAVAAAARSAVARIDGFGLVYTDVRRRHCGLYEDADGALRAVFVDLSSVVPKAVAVSAGNDIQSLEDMLAILDIVKGRVQG